MIFFFHEQKISIFRKYFRIILKLRMNDSCMIKTRPNENSFFFRICIGFEKGKISRDYARSSFLLTTQFDKSQFDQELYRKLVPFNFV